MKISLVLGIDIGGTNTSYGFVTKNGTIVFQEEILTNGDKSISDLVDRIGKRVENFFSKKVPLCGVLGCGYNKSFSKLIELHASLHRNCAAFI